MKKILLSLISVLSIVAFVAIAQQDKVLQIFRNNGKIQEYNISDIKYIEVNERPAIPGEIKAVANGKTITITWSAVEDAQYNLYRSADNKEYTLIAERLSENSYTDKTPLVGDNYYKVKAIKEIISSDFSTVAQAAIIPTTGIINGHEYVDLGLPSGLKWATCNVGASTSTDYGDYFAWGETTPKTEYKGSNSTTYDKEIGEISGNQEYDAARANWGETWRMPTESELTELMEKCRWEYTSVNGIVGYNIIGPNGNHIFLPSTGYRDGSKSFSEGITGYYWSSTQFDAQNSYVLVSNNTNPHVNKYNSYKGRSVRAVSGPILTPSGLVASVNDRSITLSWFSIAGATYNIYRSPDNKNFSALATGLTEAQYTDKSPLKGTNYYRVKAVINGKESGYSSSATATLPDIKLESGIYLGITGFNQALYPYSVSYLNKTSFAGFNSFIDGLTMKNGTILYYSVEDAMNVLQDTPLPSDVSTVAIVTFTDGLDQGSLAMSGMYEDRQQYLNAVNQRLISETVSGQKLIAYSIGLRGTDVTDNTMFTNNLKKLAYPEQNAKEVTNISEVNSKFEEIAKTLSESNYIQKVTLNCPVVSNGARIRFTLDNVTSPSSVNNSKLYIEGTYNFKEKSLENITYKGMECESGVKVTGVQDGIFISFTFDRIRTTDNILIKPAYIREWEKTTSGAGWQINSEFDTENGADVEVTRSSAAIMLVLDCSSSLGTQFNTIKSSAKNFISILYDAMNQGSGTIPGTDPSPVGTINGHEYVDLGLPSGLKWATCNVGASTPTGYGNEVHPKSWTD